MNLSRSPTRGTRLALRTFLRSTGLLSLLIVLLHDSTFSVADGAAVMPTGQGGTCPSVCSCTPLTLSTPGGHDDEWVTDSNVHTRNNKEAVTSPASEKASQKVTVSENTPINGSTLSIGTIPVVNTSAIQSNIPHRTTIQVFTNKSSHATNTASNVDIQTPGQISTEPHTDTPVSNNDNSNLTHTENQTLSGAVTVSIPSTAFLIPGSNLTPPQSLAQHASPINPPSPSPQPPLHPLPSLKPLPTAKSPSSISESVPASGNSVHPITTLPLPPSTGVLVNCSGRGLEVNDLLSLTLVSGTTSELTLDGNQLKGALPAGLGTRLSEVTDLSVSNNQLSDLSGTRLCPENQPTSLQRLSLDRNQLVSLGSALRGCTQLQVLSLRDNSLTLTSVTTAVSDLSALRVLDVSYNELGGDGTSLPLGMASLKGLRELRLEGMDIRLLGEEFFTPLSSIRLQHLRVADNILLGVTPGALRPLGPSLLSLNVSHTHLSANASQVLFQDLAQWTQHLQTLDLSANFEFGVNSEGVFESEGFFAPLDGLGLRVLHLERNAAGFASGVLHRGLLAPMRHLQELYLDGNQLHTLHPRALTRLHSLRILSLRHNLLACITGCPTSPGPTPLALPALESLDLAYNVLDTDSSFMSFDNDELPTIKQLDLSGNRLRYVSGDLFIEINTLESLDLSYNTLLINIEPEAFVTQSAMRELRIAGCPQWQHLADATFSGLRALTDLSLSHNALHSLAPRALEGLPALATLDLSHGEIQGSLNLSNAANSIEVLDISYNSIEQLILPRHSNGNTCNLRQIYIQHNRISDISFLQYVTDLQVLDVSSNMLRNVDISLLQQFQDLAQINIASNPFYCDESVLPLSQWIISNSDHVVMSDNITCHAPESVSGTLVVEFALSNNKSSQHVQKSPSHLLMIVFLVLSVIFVVVVVLVAVFVVRRKRSRLRSLQHDSVFHSSHNALVSSTSTNHNDSVYTTTTSDNNDLICSASVLDYNEPLYNPTTVSVAEERVVTAQSSRQEDTVSPRLQALMRWIPLRLIGRPRANGAHWEPMDAPLMAGEAETEANI